MVGDHRNGKVGGACGASERNKHFADVDESVVRPSDGVPWNFSWVKTRTQKGFGHNG